MPVVDRGLVHAAAPDGVLGHVERPGVHVGRELVGEGEDALGGQAATVLVHGGEGGDHLVHQLDLVVAQVARRLVVGDGVQQLPEQGRPVVGVAGQQLVQEGGARAAEAGDHDGRVDRLLEDRRLLVPQVDHAQAVLQDELELAAGAEAAGQVEVGLVVEGGAQAAEGLLPPVVAEVVEPGGGRWRRPAGPRDASETTERPSSPRPRPRATILLRPGAAWRRGPGHGRHGTRNGGEWRDGMTHMRGDADA